MRKALKSRQKQRTALLHAFENMSVSNLDMNLAMSAQVKKGKFEKEVES